MPDNQRAGMLENLCHDLVPNKNDKLWKLACDSAKAAKDIGAPYSARHSDKAQINTWLAWQDEPGMRMGVAITNGVLEHRRESAKALATWVGKLFEMPIKVL